MRYRVRVLGTVLGGFSCEGGWCHGQGGGGLKAAEPLPKSKD